MGDGFREWLHLDRPAIWGASRSIVVHETVGIVLMHAHIMFKAKVVGELRGVIGCSGARWR